MQSSSTNHFVSYRQIVSAVAAVVSGASVVAAGHVFAGSTA